MEIQSFESATPSVYNIICCPEILNVNKNAFSICNNSVCRQQLHVSGATKILSCSSRCKKLLTINYEIEINVSLQIKPENDDLSCVAIFSPEIVALFGSEIIQSPTKNTVNFIKILFNF